MNLELTDEQTFLREAARARSRVVKTIALRARCARGPGAAAEPLADGLRRLAGGLLSQRGPRRAGLSAFEAMLVMTEPGACWRVSRCSHLPASALLDAARRPPAPARSPRAELRAASSRRGRRATSRR